MAFDFPASPTPGTVYTPAGGPSWTWNGTAWVISSLGGPPLAFASLFQARLTLETGVAVSTTDQTAKGTLYLTPYLGSQISLFVSSQWVLRTLSEISIALSGVATASRTYDVFVYDNAGTPALELLAWTSDTARATALALQDGIQVKSGDATRRYVGTIWVDASKQCADSKAKRHVWNQYNRVARQMQVLETTGSWTYASSTIRQANAAAANQLDFVRGLDEEVIEVTAGCLATIGTALDAFRVGIGLDSTTAFAVDCLCGNHRASAGGVNEGSFMFAKYCGRPGLGRHLLTWLEQRSVGTGTISFYGNTNSTSGITASSRT